MNCCVALCYEGVCSVSREVAGSSSFPRWPLTPSLLAPFPACKPGPGTQGKKYPRQGVGCQTQKERDLLGNAFYILQLEALRPHTSAPGREERQREEEEEWVSGVFIFQAILNPPEGTHTQGRI